MHKIIGALFLALAVYYVYTMYRDYKDTVWDLSDPHYDTTWERLWAVGKGSAVKTWSRIVGLVSSLIGAAAGAAVWVTGNPDLIESIKQYLDPQLVTGVLIVCMILSEVARNRTKPE